jgi:cbb3-type cytochrome oxidase maturation protein
MSVIYLMVPIALVLAGSALAAFLWAVHRGQFDDLDTQRFRVLMDDDPTDTKSPARPGRSAGASTTQSTDATSDP